MPEKPSFSSDYKREDLELVRQTCLYVATKLGDLLDDLVVVGGLVPSLLIPDESLPAGEDVHIGTVDLDLGLSLALLDTKRYEDLSLRLYRADFRPDGVGPSRVAQFSIEGRMLTSRRMSPVYQGTVDQMRSCNMTDLHKALTPHLQI